MSDFQLTNALLLLTGFTCTVVGVLVWVHCSSQQEVPRTTSYASKLTLRVAVLFALFWVFCEGLRVSAVVIMFAAFVGPAVLAFWLGSAGGEVGVAAAWLVGQFILGFPARSEIILAPAAGDGETSHRTQEVVGQTGVSIGPLRPMGYIEVNNARYEAASESGSFIEGGTKVLVRRVEGGKLLVDELP